MDAVADIKDRLAIEDVVGEYIQLKRAGRNFKGLSPFANEKTPSLMVSPEKQIWHDFSSGKGGNVFSFIMEVEGLDFKGALELLARKAGIDLSQYKTSRPSSAAGIKERLYKALEAAAHFYQVQLTKNPSALTYVRTKRGFSKETIIAFRLGYSPQGGKELLNHLLAKSFTIEELRRAGLITQRSGGMSDMFRGRLMVPLFDEVGRVVGFTARLLENDDNAPKYINTPATLLYDKGRQAYGFHMAKDAIRKSGYVVIVEGNLDVIASHQAGVSQVVATAGTAMTVYHLKMLKRFTSDIRLCFDQDSAGQNAAERAIDLANEAGVTLQMVRLPSGKDPDELVRADVEKWRATIEEPQYVIDWLMDRHKEKIDITSAVGKRTYTDIILKIVSRLKDTVEQDHYVQKLATMLGIHPDALRAKIKGGPKEAVRHKQVKATYEVVPVKKDQIVRAQHLLAILFQVPALRDCLAALPEDIFYEEEALALRTFLIETPEFNKATAKDYAPALRNIADYVKMMTLLYEELYQQTEQHELAYQTEQLTARLVHEYVKNKKQYFIQKLATDIDANTTQAILEEVKKLDNLASSYKK
jgi:DNA primase